MTIKISELALSKKAKDIKILDLRNLSDVADYFVVCSGDVSQQVKAIIDAIEEGLLKNGIKPWHIEGYSHANWVILDYVDVVVHVFNQEIRQFYDLEGLWGDAPCLEIKDSS
ncbi:MAG: ribosome silencing factor [candidate division Zixibacteria bacterium]|nr:ribosome silencing factor [candidate division Zixibacteria bacterium]